jgi:hypothetical protein
MELFESLILLSSSRIICIELKSIDVWLFARFEDNGAMYIANGAMYIALLIIVEFQSA